LFGDVSAAGFRVLIGALRWRRIRTIESSVAPYPRPSTGIHSMSIAPLSTSATSSSSTGTSGRTELSEHIGRPQASAASGAGSTLDSIAEGVVSGVSATVAFSGEALHALEQAGELVVDGAEDLAVGAWHGLEHGAQAVEHVGEVVVDAVETGAREIAETAVAAGRQLAHYAAVGAHATGEAVSDVASGTVMAASAAGKTIMSLI
jgi:hypothetical protein